MDTEEFIRLARQKHGDYYDYSEARYSGNRRKITITCPKHGKFQQLAKTHLRGSGCRQCGLARLNSDRHRFIQRAESVHGSKYDYSKVIYADRHTKVIIVCPEHGEFEQKPLYHLRGCGCPRCRQHEWTSSEDYLARVSQIHNDIYRYKLNTRIRLSDVISIWCPRHDWFEQTAINHLSGKGCRLCATEKVANTNRSSREEFIAKAFSTHGSKYDYESVEYSSANSRVRILCPIHGTFWQTPSEHLRGAGCPQCALVISKGHLALTEFLGGLGVDFIVNDREVITPFEIDIYIPSFQLGIEFHGGYWHSHGSRETRKQKYAHANKYELATAADIRLLQFFDFEFILRPNVVYSIISHALRKSCRIHARKCRIKNISNEQCDNFFAAAHLQGARAARYRYALIHDDKIVSAMSISPNRGRLEIIRYATCPYLAVVGGGSKLFKHVLRQRLGREIITFADRRISSGAVYRTLGFSDVYVTAPNYCYLTRDGKLAYSRQQCQKHKLPRILGSTFNPELSEAENMFSHGYRRIWDAGHYKLIYTDDRIY